MSVMAKATRKTHTRICCKKKSRQSMCPLLNESRTLFMQNVQKGEILNVSFALLERSVFKN